MKTKFIVAVAAFTVACSATTSFATQPLGSAFAYQGRLNDGGAPANGHYDMIFNLYDALTNGNVIGSFSIFGAVPVSNGLFTVELNADNEFGTNAFNGQARWLQIGVRTNNNNAMNPWVFLDPRQPLDCAPQAMFAQNASNAMTASFASTVADGSISSSKLAPGTLEWTNISGIPAGFADGVDNNTAYSAGAGLTLSGANQFSVIFAGTGASNSAARSDHEHFGAKWSGNSWYSTGLSVTNSSGAFATGVYGQQGDGSGFPYFFGSISAGVWGESSQGSGVYGATGYENGNGVFGYAVKTNGNSAGVGGQSASTSGVGVRGLASATTGFALGMRGETKSSAGYGVAGYASSLAGTATGVYGESSAVNGAGLYGHSTFVSGVGANYGVIGQSDSISGYGVYGHTTSPNGLTYGVAGKSDSLSGYGVYGLGGSGVVGKSDASYGVGVVGQCDGGAGFGVVARNANGVSLKAAGTGIIQSDADSVIWIPGSASLGFNDHRTYVSRVGGPRITFPLTVPAVLYGQKTTLKSIEVSYGAAENWDGDVRVTGTSVYSGDYDYPDPQVYKDTTSRYAGMDKKSYTIQLNYPLSESSPCLNLSIDALAPGHIPDYLTYIHIYGIKLRFSHK